ncbi:restriction endonuclease [Rhodococcus erythropolis]|nr:restriction endonuclease [Rhodococcus erythropolis]
MVTFSDITDIDTNPVHLLHDVGPLVVHSLCMSDLGSPAPVSTSVLWGSVIGAQLEELLYGLLDAMGAKELVWRAGSDQGVTASDGGRDLEAVFVQPTPDGEEDRTRWWVESKGRGSTVPRDEVTSAINNLTSRNDVDIFVFCTNSRFSNPTRDWVSDWQKSHPRPKVRLWDRDTLDRLIRDHPTVAARVLPEALDEAQRLELLVHRFWQLGETPTERDLIYFWERPSFVIDSPDSIRAIATFTYAEVEDGLIARSWGTLVQNEPRTIIETLVTGIFDLPRLSLASLARPLNNEHMVETAAYLLMSVMPYWSANKIFRAISNLADFIDDDDFPLKDPEAATAWTQYVTIPIFGRIQDELADVCTDDCVRINTKPKAFPPPMLGKRYWRRFGLGEAPDNRNLIIESCEKPCVVGLTLDLDHRCPLIAEPEFSLPRVEELHHVIQFRREHPEDQYWTAEGYTRPTIASFIEVDDSTGRRDSPE